MSFWTLSRMAGSLGLTKKGWKSDQWSDEGGGSKAKTLTMPGQMEELKS